MAAGVMRPEEVAVSALSWEDRSFLDDDLDDGPSRGVVVSQECVSIASAARGVAGPRSSRSGRRRWPRPGISIDLAVGSWAFAGGEDKLERTTVRILFSGSPLARAGWRYLRCVLSASKKDFVMCLLPI
ncbi:hypothetical protein ACQJBY_015550 [Aegilops geniculata]